MHTVLAIRHIRRLRGGAQAQLIQAEDGHYYAVKFLDNPQEPRVIVNDWIAAAIFRELGLATPATAAVEVSDVFLEDEPGCCRMVGERHEPFAPGLAFGSRWVVDSLEESTYEHLPNALLARVANVREFAGALAVDRWLNNQDGRQAVFYRDGNTWRASFIDHGYALGGPYWEWRDYTSTGLYLPPLVYDGVRGMDDFEPWLSGIEGFRPAALRAIFESVPEWWLTDTERAALDCVLADVITRRRTVRRDLERLCDLCRGDLLPAWGSPVANLRPEPQLVGASA